MKMIVNASGVKQLLEIDPEGTVELAKNSAQQVAHEIVRRVNSDAAKKSIESIFSKEFSSGPWYSSKINEKYQKMITDFVQQITLNFVNSLTTGQLNKIILEKVDEVFLTKQNELEQQMRDTADKIIMERFGKLFNTP